MALGTAGIVGVVGAIMFACILIGVTICTFTCCKKSCKNCWGNLCSKCKQHNKIGNQGKTGKLPQIEPSAKPRKEQTKKMADKNKETVVMVDQSKETFNQTNKIKDIRTVDNIRKPDDNDRLDLVDDPKETAHQAKTRDVKETTNLTKTRHVKETTDLTKTTNVKETTDLTKTTNVNELKVLPIKTDSKKIVDLPKKTADLTKTSDVNERISRNKKIIDQTNTIDVKDLTEKTDEFDKMNETKELVDKETVEQGNINVKGTVSQPKQTGDQTTADRSNLKPGLSLATNLTINPLQVSDANNKHFSEQEERKNTNTRGRQPALDITKVDS